MLLNAPQPLGELALRRVYFEHDGPRLFSALRPADDRLFIGNCVDEDTQTIRFLYWTVTRDQLDSVEQGVVTLLDSMRNSPAMFIAVERYLSEEPSVEVLSIDIDDLPDAYLPDRSARLTDLQPRPLEAVAVVHAPMPEDSQGLTAIRPVNPDRPFLRPYSLPAINEVAARDGHLYLAVEVKGDEDSPVSLSDVSSVGVPIQKLLYALGAESLGKSNKSLTVKRALDMTVEGAMAASFVLVLRTPDQGHLTESSISISALRTFTSILKSTTEAEELVRELTAHSRQVRRHVRDLLTSASEDRLAVTAVVTDGQEVTWGSITPAFADECLVRLTQEPPSIETLPLDHALLTALNLTRRTFEVWDRASGHRYTGELSDEVLAAVDGLRVSSEDQWYSVVLRIETAFAQDSEEPSQRRRLISIESTPPPEQRQKK